jgi:hypothetical protein
MSSWLILQLISIASMPAVYDMARNRGRSTRAWLYIAVVVGPLAVLALLVLGARDAEAKQPAPN